MGLLFWQKNIRTKILFNIRKEIVDNILELKVSNFDKNSTGFFQERVRHDSEIIARVVNAVQRYLTNCITGLGVITYIMCINWVLGLIYIAGIILVALIDDHTQKVSKEKNRNLRAADEKVNSILSELIRGIRDIKLLNFKNTIRNNVIEKLNDNNDKIVDRNTYQEKTCAVTDLVIYATVFLVIVVGIKLVDLGIITASELIVLYLYNSNVFSLMTNFSVLIDCIKEYELAVERIYELEDSTKYPKDNYGKISILNLIAKSYDVLKGRLLLDDLCKKAHFYDCVKSLNQLIIFQKIIQLSLLHTNYHRL